IADYATKFDITSKPAYETARYCLMDTLGCGLEALEYPACTKLLGPIVPGPIVPNGAKVPGTRYQLDPVQAAFNIGAMIRWLDFNDTWLAAEWGHPSDNLGAILAVADWLSRNKKQPLLIKDVVTARSKAHEDQGVLTTEARLHLTGKTWGFYDLLCRGRGFKFQRPFGSYVMENVLFKISYPAEFHAQTAVECAMKVFQEMKKLGKTATDIRKIRIRTHEAAMRII